MAGFKLLCKIFGHLATLVLLYFQTLGASLHEIYMSLWGSLAHSLAPPFLQTLLINAQIFSGKKQLIFYCCTVHCDLCIDPSCTNLGFNLGYTPRLQKCLKISVPLVRKHWKRLFCSCLNILQKGQVLLNTDSATWYSTHTCAMLLRFNCVNGVYI
jgi:hypothetical protein